MSSILTYWTYRYNELVLLAGTGGSLRLHVWSFSWSTNFNLVSLLGREVAISIKYFFMWMRSVLLRRLTIPVACVSIPIEGILCCGCNLSMPTYVYGVTYFTTTMKSWFLRLLTFRWCFPLSLIGLVLASKCLTSFNLVFTLIAKTNCALDISLSF